MAVVTDSPFSKDPPGSPHRPLSERRWRRIVPSLGKTADTLGLTTSILLKSFSICTNASLNGARHDLPSYLCCRRYGFSLYPDLHRAGIGFSPSAAETGTRPMLTGTSRDATNRAARPGSQTAYHRLFQ